MMFNRRMDANTPQKVPPGYHADAALIDAVGGPSALAGLLGYTESSRVQRVQNWKYRGIPEAVKLRLRYELRPDLFEAA